MTVQPVRSIKLALHARCKASGAGLRRDIVGLELTLGQFILKSHVIVAKIQDFGEKGYLFFTIFLQIAPKRPILQRHLTKIVCSFIVGNGGFFVELFLYN